MHVDRHAAGRPHCYSIPEKPSNATLGANTSIAAMSTCLPICAASHNGCHVKSHKLLATKPTQKGDSQWLCHPLAKLKRTQFLTGWQHHVVLFPARCQLSLAPADALAFESQALLTVSKQTAIECGPMCCCCPHYMAAHPRSG